MISDRYWGKEKDGFSWFGWVRDTWTPNSITSRPKLQELLLTFDRGDLILISWFGVLCHTLDDAIEGLPAIVGRGVRVYSVGERIEIEEQHLPFIRMLRREWYVNTTNYGPMPLGAVKGTKYVRRKYDEIRFMQFCYRKHIKRNKTAEWVAKIAAKTWRVHPRYGTPINQDQVRNAVDAYYDVLTSIYLDRKMPAWVNEARTKGYFNETIKEIVESRRAEFYRLAESAKE